MLKACTCSLALYEALAILLGGGLRRNSKQIIAMLSLTSSPSLLHWSLLLISRCALGTNRAAYQEAAHNGGSRGSCHVYRLSFNAIEARNHALWRRSHYVGAALSNGTVYGGCQPRKSAAYTPYDARLSARVILAIALVVRGQQRCTPCGVCRRVVAILQHSVLCWAKGERGSLAASVDILPMEFGPEDLGGFSPLAHR